MTQTKTFFLPSAKLGVLEAHVQQMLDAKDKAKRRAAFNRLSRLVRDLQLVQGERIVAISWGVGVDGVLGMFVQAESTVKLNVQIPEEPTI